MFSITLLCRRLNPRNSPMAPIAHIRPAKASPRKPPKTPGGNLRVLFDEFIYECVETQEAERQVERAFDVLFRVLLKSKQ